MQSSEIIAIATGSVIGALAVVAALLSLYYAYRSKRKLKTLTTPSLRLLADKRARMQYASRATSTKPVPPPAEKPVPTGDQMSMRRRLKSMASSRNYEKSYTGLASLMEANPEKAILRRFGKLNMLNLLYLQAELVDLEDELREAAKLDNEAFSGDWGRLAHDGDNPQWALMLEIRSVMKEYNKALQRQAFNFGLQSPHSYDLKVLRKWLERPGMGEQFLTGLDRNAWKEESDLISLGLTANEDPLAKLGDRQSDGLDWALRLLSLISTVLASVLPVVAIVILYVVQSTQKRLGILAAFTAVFAFILSVVTNARRSDVFAATAAFAAVQVVFIGASGPTATG